MSIIEVKIKTKSIGVFAPMGLCMVVLTACSVKASTDAVEQTQTAKIEQAEVTLSDAFTTEGKPTKTIETPWGPREVYDLARDREVLEAIHKVYQDEDTSFGEVSKQNQIKLPSASAEIIRIARTTHYNDMMRLGCKSIMTIPCQRHSPYLVKPCKESSLGSYKLSNCEAKNIGPVTGEVGGIAYSRILDPLVKKKYKGVNPHNYFVFHKCEFLGLGGIQAPLFIGEISELTKRETIDQLTASECTAWHGEDYFK